MLVAPAKNITAEGITNNGTSCAAPQVAGASAQLQEYAPALLIAPEATRSILMAGADENVNGGRFDLHDGVDDRDGAGELNVFLAHVIASNPVQGGNTPAQFGYAFDWMTATNTPAGTFHSQVYRAIHSVSGGRLRVVLNWDSTATCTNPTLDTFSCSSDTLDADLDLFVFRHSDGALMAASTTSVNSYEFVEFATTSGEQYDIKIRAVSWAASSTYYGLAFLQATFPL